MMRVLTGITVVLFSMNVYAQAPASAQNPEQACEAKALSKDGKPLSGAAKNASMKKCMAGAVAGAADSKKADCEAKALSKDGKALSGAAKNASVKKCMAG